MKILDDKKLYFGTGGDAYIEYDEDGNDTWVFSPPAGGLQILDDKKLVFGDDYDLQKEKIINPLLEFTDKMQEDIGTKIVKKVQFSYAYVIILCLANLILIILINDRLDLSISDEE